MPSKVLPKNALEEKAIVQSALGVMKSKYKEVCIDYRALGTKIFTLTATELAAITFIFASNTDFKLTLLYGSIFFGIGIGALALSLGTLFWSITSNAWASPGDLNELDNLNFSTEIDFLKYLMSDYLEAYEFCRNSFNKRRRAFDISVMLFLFGAIILMVLKFGGYKI